MGWAALAISVIVVGFILYVVYHYMMETKKKQELERIKEMRTETLEDLGLLSFQNLSERERVILIALAENPVYLRKMWDHPENYGNLHPVLSQSKRAHSE